jgi:hypothetical protein
LLAASDRQAILAEVWGKQGTDGGWSLESLGPWKSRPNAPRAEGSNSYATALTAFSLERAGVPSADRRLARALDWLKSHQDRVTGAWAAQSMNHSHDAGSMTGLFMQDAASAYAALALSGGR